MKRYFPYFFYLLLASSCQFEERESIESASFGVNSDLAHLETFQQNVRDTFVINATFLGNENRNYYGTEAPDSLRLIWKHFLGKGFTVVNPKDGMVEWRGAGWTGQPLMMKEGNDLFLFQGAYDHQLKKINARTGEIVWNYAFDNVIKGTGTIVPFKNEKGKSDFMILQGSRKNLHKSLSASGVYSFRAVSYSTGKELWRMPVKKGQSYSRDVDASALIFNEKGYVPTENGYLTIFDPFHCDTLLLEDSLVTFLPKIIKEIPLFEKNDHLTHGGNLVPESSPLISGDKMFVTSGSGHVYGIDLNADSVYWRYTIGADLNGTPALCEDGGLLVPVEKQYIKGNGGVLKLRPGVSQEEAVEWFQPTSAKGYASWNGGVIGSVVTFEYDNSEWAAFQGIDGFLYVIQTEKHSENTVLGPDAQIKYKLPSKTIKIKTAPSISTPVFVPPNKIFAATYSGLYAFHFENDSTLVQDQMIKGGFEATPFVYEKKVFLASRDGYLYCWGDTIQEQYEAQELIAENDVDEVEVTAIDTVLFVDNEASEELAFIARLNDKPKSPDIKYNYRESKKPIDLHQSYHLIVGAFSEPGNAEGKLKSLLSEGYDQAVVLPQIKGLDYVSVKNFKNKTEAEEAMKSLKVSTWLYFYP